ncbi:MAG: dTDP-4-dehydrorhamnose reductase [Acidobacteriota bacterium]|nr:dTDP-4-dehydrorhamnose reductase [Acidobacteriota bacterium]MDH3529404.1 dTDP-4-dehydrorhamnose reductase [Acidobacteriota bacterium]
MKIVVTGARGLVGRAVTAHCRDAGDSVTAAGHRELDITSKTAVRAFFEREQPDAVVNCAAYTDVDGAESNPELSLSVNRDGVRYLAGSAKTHRCAFLTISTDFVFDGNAEGFYTEDDVPRPISVYGKSKLEGEHAAAAEYEKSIIVRTGWVFGTGGTNFLSTLKDVLNRDEPVTAIEDSFGTPTFASDLAERIRELLEPGRNGLFHVANSGPGTSYYGFAVAAARILGVDSTKITGVPASSLNRPAPRPANSRLLSINASKLGLPDLPFWQDALGRHLSHIS